MKEIVLDTETTGLEVAHNHRIIEIGCVELISGHRSGKVFHTYVNPARSVSPEALQVHGIEDTWLRKQPLFSEIAESFLNFIKDARLVIHNAEFDLGFLNMELRAIQKPELKNEVIDTLQIAREKFPNQSNRLDALCQRFGIDIAQRVKHGALLDAGLLAEVYIALSVGEQASFALAAEPQRAPAADSTSASLTQISPSVSSSGIKPPSPVRLTSQEIIDHQAFIKRALGKNALWLFLCDIKEEIDDNI